MARRKAIPKKIDTEYFTGVTPLWVPPGQSEIPEKYHDAVWALAEWAGTNWSKNDATDFFLIRQVIIGSCEAWTSHDWDLDKTWILERREDLKQIKRMKRSGQVLRALIGPNRFKRFKVHLVTILLSRLQIDLPNALTNGE